VEQPLSIKERAQLMELREDWGKSLVEAIWSWDEGEALPLRLLVESLMETAPWLNRGELDEVRKREKKENSRPVDWSRERLPFCFFPWY
jgi:hypothetical protein